MKIKSHSESHIVELDDCEGAKVHVLAAGESWPVQQVKYVLKEG